MNFKEIEKKWQKDWADKNIYKFDENKLDKKYYLLEMFSYPSAARLHLGHWWNFGLSDSFGRFKRMQGYNVFQPMGFDAFGLPAENYAIKTGIHPETSTRQAMKDMEVQLKTMGATFNWEYEIKTCDPEYYKWTQWLFIQLYKNGLAYQKYSPVNWCTSCNTVLANEQVVDGVCERCKSTVVKKDLTQWFFKITDFAEEMLEGLNRIDWPEKTKISQRNWIGKSIGAEAVFVTTDNKHQIKVFTSRVDTICGVSFVVIAPENALVKELTTAEHKKEVEEYCFKASTKDDITRTCTTDEKTGVFTGSYCFNPVTKKKVPVFVADYVLNSYGTGAVMGVAAHDSRDFLFAKKYNLDVIEVIENNGLPFCDDGILKNSGEFSGLTSAVAREKITNYLESVDLGNKKTNYKLRDWSVSRQRYWGCPIPMIHCEHCGTVPESEENLPVRLPEKIDYTPDGRSPLGKSEEYMNCTCPKCGRPARRDPDTLDTFVCSSWYYLRYPNASNNDVAFDKNFTNKMLPVDKYVGGIEHATSHLLYSRFITKFLYKMGYINFDEPFKSLVHQGMILGKDGQKMSKSRGNTVNASDLVDEYGSDALRLYLMFGFNYLEGGPWSEDGIKNMVKFMERVERLVNSYVNETSNTGVYGTNEEDLEFVLNNSIKNCISSMEDFGFNTYVAKVMELVNALYKYDSLPEKNRTIYTNAVESLIKMLAPVTPHFAEELWQITKHTDNVVNQKFPTLDETKLVKKEVEIVVQINSKIVSRIVVPTDIEQDEALLLAEMDSKVSELINGKELRKIIYVKNKLINIIK